MQQRVHLAAEDLLTEACFEAATPHGPIRLTALDAETVRHAAEAAIAFARFALPAAAIEAWVSPSLGAPLDWRWRPSPSLPLAAAALWGDEAGARPTTPCRIEFPLTLLRALPAPPEPIAALLRWESIPVVLAAATLDLGADELEALEPGGAVVLADSLRGTWLGSLRGAEEPADCGLPVRLGVAPDFSVQVLTSGKVAASKHFEVRLSARATLPADQLAGWSKHSLDNVAMHASLWRAAGAAPRSIAKGRLIPWGAGWALAIESVCRAG